MPRSQSKSPPSSGLRRSSRERRPATTMYDEAAAAAEEEAQIQASSEKTSQKKRKVDRTTHNEDEDDAMEVDEGQVSSEEEEGPAKSSPKEKTEEDSDSDFESKVQKPKKQTAPSAGRKRRKVAAATTAARGRGGKNPGLKNPAKKAGSAAFHSLFKNYFEKDETAENSILVALSQVGGSTTTANKRTAAKNAKKLTEYTRQLVREHNDDPNVIHVRLYNFIFRACGADGSTLLPADTDLENLPDEDLSNYTSQVLHSMQFTSEVEAPWTANPPTSGAKLEFRKLYQEFWHALGLSILESTNTTGEADDDDSSDSENEDDQPDGTTFKKKKKGTTSPRFQVEAARTLITRLMELCFLHEVHLRSAFTTALYSVATAILHKTVEFQETVKTAERQYQAAKRNKQSRKAEALKVQVDTEKRMLGDLEEIVQTSVGAVFLNRYKDVDPHIRAATMMAMADWCAVRPDIYFDRKLLKYAAWTLCDKVPVVREAALTALLRPLKNNADKIKSMGGLIEKTAPRLADCVIDVNESVQESAMELLLLLSRTGVLDAMEDQGFWDQINLRAIDPVTTPKVRVLALLFIIEQLGSFDNDKPDSDSSSVECLNELAGWVAHNLAQGDIPLDQMRFEYSAYIIHSLRACPEHEALARDFPTLVKAFQNSLNADVSRSGSKKARRERTVSDAKQRVLLFFLMTAVEEEVSLADPEQLMDYHLEEPATGQRQKASVRDSMTRSLLPTLPNLITSFKSDDEVLHRLVKLPLYFSPAACGVSDQKQNFKKILATLSDCFKDSSDDVVLQNCCHSLSFLATADHARQDEAMATLRSIFNSSRKRLSDLVEKKKSESEDSSIEKVDHSISLILRRLAVLAKRWPLLDLLGEGDSDDDAVVDQLCAEVFRLATNELDIRKPFSEDDKTPIAKIWKEEENASHAYVLDTVKASLDILLSTAGWTLRKVSVELDGSSPEGSDENDGKPNPLLLVRQRVDAILSLCFEQYHDDPDSLSPEHREFSEKAQHIAGSAAGDLRVLFLHGLKKSVHRPLREAALVEDNHLSGGCVRFIRQQKETRSISDDTTDPSFTSSLLLPTARGLIVNWETGNRREAGVLLANVLGSGSEAASLVSTTSAKLKQINNVRLLEAQMACLCMEFEAWAKSEPAEPESENPTDEENAAFEAAEKEHEEKFAALENLTRKLSSSLGFGKRNGAQIKNGLLGFVREGLRFAFSRDDPDSDDLLPLGARLAFLRLLAKFASPIKNDSEAGSIIRALFNQNEDEVRSHPDFDDVLESDIEAIEVFRKSFNLGPLVIEDDTTVGGRSMGASSYASSRASDAFRRRLSQGGSVSSVPSKASTKGSNLSPLREERDSETEDDGDSQAGSPAGKSSIASSISRIFNEARLPVEAGSDTDGSP